MVAVIDRKLVFGREQVLTSTQASKNFGRPGAARARSPSSSRTETTESNTVIVGYEEFEAMAVELEQLRRSASMRCGGERLAQGRGRPSRKGIPFADVVGRDGIRCHGGRRRATDPVADAELFSERGQVRRRFYNKDAEKEYLSLDGSVKAMVDKGIARLALRADEIGKPLGGLLAGCRELKFRADGIRVVYRIRGGRVEVVQIVAIGPQG